MGLCGKYILIINYIKVKVCATDLRKRQAKTALTGVAQWVGCGSANGHWFDSQTGHKPGLWARSQVEGLQEATDWCFSGTSIFLSSSFSLPSSLPKNKYIKSFFKKAKIKEMREKRREVKGKYFFTCKEISSVHLIFYYKITQTYKKQCSEPSGTCHPTSTIFNILSIFFAYLLFFGSRGETGKLHPMG